METKVNQVPKIVFFSKPTILPHAQRFCLESLEHNKDLLRKRFQGLTEKWKFRVEEQWKYHYSSQQCLVHVVREGESLTSISRLYGVSVQSIAVVNEKIVNIDLVYNGQRLRIPSSGFNNAMKDYTWKTRLYCFSAQDRCQRALNILVGQGNHKIFTMLSSHHLLRVKTNGSYLVLVPLIAFCISCIISAFQHKVGEDLKHPDVNDSNAHHHGSRSIRWKTALSDIGELNVLDAKSEQDSINPPGDQPPVSFEEMSHAYTKIEPAYQKFLSECGISESGYWRGGTPE